MGSRCHEHKLTHDDENVAARAEFPGSADILSAKNADKMSALPVSIFVPETKKVRLHINLTRRSFSCQEHLYLQFCSW